MHHSEDSESEFSPSEALQDAAASTLFGEDGPCPISVEHGSRQNVLVISGENAGGKSFLCRALQGHVAAGSKRVGTPVEFMRIGMDTRTASGIQRAFIYSGSEDQDSTGQLSVSSVLSGIKTARNRENPHWLVFDEPDVGLGEGYRKAMGELFAAFAADLPENTIGFAVVTHSREIAAPMIAAGATSVRVGDDRRPVTEWIRDGDLPKTIDDLETLHKRAIDRMRSIRAAIAADKAEQKAESTAGPR